MRRTNAVLGKGREKEREKNTDKKKLAKKLGQITISQRYEMQKEGWLGGESKVWAWWDY